MEVGIAAAVTSGGGGGSSLQSFVVSITAGPLAMGHGLSVAAFDQQGNSLDSDITINDDGTFTIQLTVDYSGPILLQVMDSGTGDDFYDEATGVGRDLTVDLRAVFVADGSGGGDIAVNITPLTEKAASLLVSGGIIADSDAVNSINEAISNTFGVPDIISSDVVATIDENGDATDDANTYGEILALLSGLDEKIANPSNAMQETIDTFTKGLVVTEDGSLAVSDGQDGTELVNQLRTVQADLADDRFR